VRYTSAVAVTDPLSEWALDPWERSAVEQVYLRGRTLADTAVALHTDVATISRALQSAFRRIAATPTTPGRSDGDRIRSAAPLPTALSA
jgi:hypothetical protein